MNRSAFFTCVAIAAGMWWSLWMQIDLDNQPGVAAYTPSSVAGILAVVLSLSLATLALKFFRRAKLLWIVAAGFVAGTLVCSVEWLLWTERFVKSYGEAVSSRDLAAHSGPTLVQVVQELALAGIVWVPIVAVVAVVLGVAPRKLRGAHA